MCAVPGVQTQREMSQQLLEYSRSLRKSTACLMHPPLLELTLKRTHTHTSTHAHTHMHPSSHTWGLVFLLVVPFNEEEGVKGPGGAVQIRFFRISGVVHLQMRQKMKRQSQLQNRFQYLISNRRDFIHLKVIHGSRFR